MTPHDQIKEIARDRIEQIEKALLQFAGEVRKAAIRECAELVENACHECDERDCYSKALLSLIPKKAEDLK